MATLRFLLKRFFAQRLLGLAIVVTLGFTIGVLVAGPIYADAAREAILSSATSTAPVTVGNVRFLTYGDPSFDYSAADADLEDAVSELPVDEVVPQGRGTVRLLGADPTAPLSLTVMFRDGATEHLPYRGRGPRWTGRDRAPRWHRAPAGRRSRRDRDRDRPDGRAGDAHPGRSVRPSRTRRPLLVRDQTPFPPPDSTELPEALRFASRVVLLRDGKVEAEGRPQEISARLTVD